MSELGKEKSAEKKFRITGKYSGGMGSSGYTGLGRFGNNWEAEAKSVAKGGPSQRPTISIPKKKSFGKTVKSQIIDSTRNQRSREAAAKERSRLTKRNDQTNPLFGIRHPAQLIPYEKAGQGLAVLIKNIITRVKGAKD